MNVRKCATAGTRGSRLTAKGCQNALRSVWSFLFAAALGVTLCASAQETEDRAGREAERSMQRILQPYTPDQRHALQQFVHVNRAEQLRRILQAFRGSPEGAYHDLRRLVAEAAEELGFDGRQGGDEGAADHQHDERRHGSEAAEADDRQPEHHARQKRENGDEERDGYDTRRGDEAQEGDAWPDDMTERHYGEPREERVERALHDLLRGSLRDLPVEQREAFVRFMRTNFKAELEELGQLGRRHLDRARLELRELSEHMRQMFRLSEKDPEAFAKHRTLTDLERRSRRLAARYRDAGGDDREAIEGELREVLREAFQLKQQLASNEADRLAADVASMRERIEQRQAHQDQIVERRFQTLVGEDDYLEW